MEQWFQHRRRRVLALRIGQNADGRQCSRRIDVSASSTDMAAMTRGRVASGSIRNRASRGHQPQGLVGPVQSAVQVADGRTRPRAEVPQRPDGRLADLLRRVIEGGP